MSSAYGRRIAAITVVGLGARLIALGLQPLWRDEAFTGVVVQRSVGAMLDAVRHDSAPPLAYLLGNVVARFDHQPAGLRLIPALAGTALIPLAAAMGRRLGSDRSGITTAVVCCVSPATVLSARDARMYALATTLVVAAGLLLWRAVETPGWGRWITYATVVALAVHTDYFAAFGVAAQVPAVLVFAPGRRRLLAATGAAAAGTVTLVPWLVGARAQFAHGQQPFWVEPLSPKTLGGVLLQFFSGPPVDPGTPGKLPLQLLQALAIGGGCLAVIALARDRRRRQVDRRALGYLTISGLGAIALLVAVSVWHPLLEARYASAVWGPLFPLIGTGAALLGCAAARSAAIAALVATSVALGVAPLHPDTPAALRPLPARLGAHDLVSATPSHYLLVLYYGDDSVRAHLHVVAAEGVPWFWGTAAYPSGAVLPAVPSDVLANGGTIYHLDDPGDVAPPPPSGYRAIAPDCFRGVCLLRFVPQRPPPMSSPG